MPRPRLLAGIALVAAANFAGPIPSMEAAPKAMIAAPVNTANLLEEIADLASMTRYPTPSYLTKQNSSYDRASVAPDKPGWFANADHGKFVRVEQRNGRSEHVMMDATGPGTVVHIWSANPTGILRVYLDGNQTPVLEGEMAGLLNGKSGSVPAPLAVDTARGNNLYFPIPYASGCKITVETADHARLYYTVAYRAYEAGTPVQSFRREQLDALRPQIERAATRLSLPRGEGIWPTEVKPFALSLAPGASTIVADLSGAKAITQFLVQLRPEISEAALRALVVRLSFDGKQTVEAPLGDFFGTAPGPNPFSSLPLGITTDRELWSHWVMPFRRAARIQVVNMGREVVALRGQIGAAPYAWSDTSMYFHAGYISRYDVATRPMPDLNVLKVTGQGVFAGLAYAVDNPNRKWWGEGDEKITVDGETFPSWFGTGTEDYFGYAWCDTNEFSHAFHAQPRAEGPGGCAGGRGHWGRASNNRFHIFDRIPFERSLNFDMELLHWVEAKVNVASVAYWYAKAGGTHRFAPLKPADLIVRTMPEYEPPFQVAGAIEGEAMRVVSNTATAQIAPQESIPLGLSGEAHLWWHYAPKPGDRLVLGFNAPKAGTYRVLGRFVKARDYGTMQLAINGKATGTPIDFYNPEVILSQEIDLGTFDLKATGNELSAVVTGANALAEKGYMFGLDYLRLLPVGTQLSNLPDRECPACAG